MYRLAVPRSVFIRFEALEGVYRDPAYTTPLANCETAKRVLADINIELMLNNVTKIVIPGSSLLLEVTIPNSQSTCVLLLHDSTVSGAEGDRVDRWRLGFPFFRYFTHDSR